MGPSPEGLSPGSLSAASPLYYIMPCMICQALYIKQRPEERAAHGDGRNERPASGETTRAPGRAAPGRAPSGAGTTPASGAPPRQTTRRPAGKTSGGTASPGTSRGRAGGNGTGGRTTTSGAPATTPSRPHARGPPGQSPRERERATKHREKRTGAQRNQAPTTRPKRTKTNATRETPPQKQAPGGTSDHPPPGHLVTPQASVNAPCRSLRRAGARNRAALSERGGARRACAACYTESPWRRG